MSTETSPETKVKPAFVAPDISFNINPVTYGRDQATIASWRLTNYGGKTGMFYWALFTTEGKGVATGNFQADRDLLDQWGKDDSVISKAIADQEGWTIA